MDTQNIICPNCQHAFSVSDELQKNLSAEFEKKLAAEKIAMRKKAQQYAEEKAKEALKKNSVELEDMKNRLKEAEQKQVEANKKELEFFKKERALIEREKNTELEVEKKLIAERKKIEEDLKEQQKNSLDKRMSELQVEHRKKEAEMLKQQEQMRKTIDELKRKSEQGSQQIQGDVQENDLKDMLSRLFPSDLIEDVPTGIKGADIVQTVRNNFAEKSGIILWESKNTKNWTDEWLKKLKGDQALAKADICILITKTLPTDIDNFGFKNGVWVVQTSFAASLVSTLRFHLMEMKKTKNSFEGRDEKMEVLYQYLSGPQFKNKIENIVLAFDSMKTDLDKERRAMERIWKKREQELERVIGNTSGLYGDMQGIIGNSLPTISALELPTGDEEDLTLL